MHNLGNEGIHLRDNSSSNRVAGCEIYDTGHQVAFYGEGIYIGTSVNKTSSDHSDNNLIENNYIHNTTAESVDIKEFTTGGIIRNNRFDGVGMGASQGGFSVSHLVDVKGNGYTVTGNTGINAIGVPYASAKRVSGWGENNTIQ